MGKYRHTIGILSVLLASSLFHAMASESFAAQLRQFKVNSDQAMASFYTDTLSATLNISRGGSVQDQHTNIYYYIYDNTSYTYIYGYGTIPNEDFKGNWQNGLELNTDTSRIQGTVVGAGGPIKAMWKKSDDNINVTSGSTVQYTNDISYRMSGTVSYSNAFVTGEIFSFPLGGFGTMGNYNQAVITIQKGP